MVGVYAAWEPPCHLGVFSGIGGVPNLAGLCPTQPHAALKKLNLT